MKGRLHSEIEANAMKPSPISLSQTCDSHQSEQHCHHRLLDLAQGKFWQAPRIWTAGETAPETKGRPAL
jgi:hypothetical protein